ncbi:MULTISPECIES: SsrA-binding protein SmpB [Oceanibaculum]|uniref:SsrA-binding protein n=2 Tax=Oceanibaculum indicum TaxID=526216 RepID=K2J445_9PROT|nr:MULTISPECIES: SsrA-binding protein SmpB [Oceanibaculum]EKE77781.1 SsrA-binding protein SsrA [Oceanibaculum indicum P24]MCH2396441.1 SsrA-binding protein SmpB [Oceanibaculum sp.]RKQ73300.1 SsrA-binding protein [Oceanibaculum indicum]
MSGDKAAQKAERYRIVADNRRARHDYFIEDTLEVGIMLLGTEVKSLRAGRASIGESYAGPKAGELYLFNAHIPEYGQAANQMNHEPRRTRKLLVHRRELAKLLGMVKREGATLVPLQMYFNERGIAKLQLGLAKGKKLADKRETAKKRDWQRDKARLLREKG